MNVVDSAHRTALHYCTRRGITRSVELLLEHCADPDIQDVDGNTALMEATYHNLTSVVQLLVQHNCDVNIKGNNVISGHRSVLPVFYAIANFNHDLISLFHQAGCKHQGILNVCEEHNTKMTNKLNVPTHFHPELLQLSLQSHCRIAIRQHIGHGIMTKVDDLKLPNRLKMFLQFKDLSGHFQL